MMMAAKDRLIELKKEITSLFPLLQLTTLMNRSSSYSEFMDFVENGLPSVLDEHRLLLTHYPSSQNLPGWFLTTHLNRPSLWENNNFACSECFPVHSRSSVGELASSQDTCGELLLLQHRIVHHDEHESEYWEAHVRLAHEVQRRASELFESYGFPESAKWVNSLGVYHPETFSYCLPGSTANLSDCLERSQLHLCMDYGDFSDLESLRESGLDVSKLKDYQDILGRTPLLIACQETWEEAVVRLLEENADPGLSTMYGSLPLHYAAAKGSIDICQLLLSHKTRFDIKAEDCVGKTALDYARENEHQDVVNLLSAEYAAADQALEELERARSLQAGLENHEVQGSYFV